MATMEWFNKGPAAKISENFDTKKKQFLKKRTNSDGVPEKNKTAKGCLFTSKYNMLLCKTISYELGYFRIKLHTGKRPVELAF